MGVFSGWGREFGVPLHAPPLVLTHALHTEVSLAFSFPTKSKTLARKISKAGSTEGCILSPFRTSRALLDTQKIKFEN